MIDTKHDTAVDNMEELLFFDPSKVSMGATSPLSGMPAKGLE